LKTKVAFITSYLAFAAYQRWLKKTASKKLATLIFIGQESELNFHKIDPVTFEDLAMQLNELDTELLVFTPIGKFSRFINDLRRLEHLGFKPTLITPAIYNTENNQPNNMAANRFNSSGLITYPYSISDWNSEYYQDKTLMITGAGGSIGSKLALKFANFDLKGLILLDHSERAIFQLKEQIVKLKTSNKIEFALTDIRDSLRLEQLLSKHQVDIIFHLAAYKHVNLMEEDPYASFMINVVGTQKLFEVARNKGVKHFNFISTDKAVDPVNIMGVTKRIAELYLLNQKQENIKVNILRFGNILGSSGSVIQNFEKAIETSQPLIITHKDMRRYFVLEEDIIHFIANEPILAKNKDTLVFDIQNPTPILKLAEAMILLKKQQYKLDACIMFGTKSDFEKLDEVLFWDDENILNTQKQHVKRIPYKSIPAKIKEAIFQLKEKFEKNDWISLKDFRAVINISSPAKS
jgi:FlaA1/EpsC-like NDP-sugar epimerase